MCLWVDAQRLRVQSLVLAPAWARAGGGGKGGVRKGWCWHRREYERVPEEVVVRGRERLGVLRRPPCHVSRTAKLSCADARAEERGADATRGGKSGEPWGVGRIAATGRAAGTLERRVH